MKILLFGGSGQLGYEILKRARDLHFEIVSPVASELDITDTQEVSHLVTHTNPSVIINSAAYTAVDRAETDADAAFAINRDGARNVAIAARDSGAKLIHISTDYVFDGNFQGPISESAIPHPLNVYGASKLAGEEAITKELSDMFTIVRTSSLHGQKGENFVHTMIKLLTERPVISVVNDQFMSPTWAGWLAEILLDLSRMSGQGVVHACGSGAVSWYDFAQEIYRLIKPSILKDTALEPITAEKFSRPAKRPQYSVFDCSKLTKIVGRAPIPWQEGLRRHILELGYSLS